MAGTKEGGQAAARTNKRKYGSDFYAEIGAKAAGVAGLAAFAANRDLARTADTIGGGKSRRGKAKLQ